MWYERRTVVSVDLLANLSLAFQNFVLFTAVSIKVRLAAGGFTLRRRLAIALRGVWENPNCTYMVNPSFNIACIQTENIKLLGSDVNAYWWVFSFVLFCVALGQLLFKTENYRRRDLNFQLITERITKPTIRLVWGFGAEFIFLFSLSCSKTRSYSPNNGLVKLLELLRSSYHTARYRLRLNGLERHLHPFGRLLCFIKKKGEQRQT